MKEISADLISRTAQLQVSFLLLLKLKDYGKKNLTFAAFHLFGREMTAGIVKPDLFLSENQTKNTHNISHPHLSHNIYSGAPQDWTKGFQDERIEIKHRMGSSTVNEDWRNGSVTKNIGGFNN